MFPDASVDIISGFFYTDIQRSTTSDRWFGVVKDRLMGYNVLRVDFDPDMSEKEMRDYMDTMLLAAEVRYHDNQGSHHVGTF